MAKPHLLGCVCTETFMGWLVMTMLFGGLIPLQAEETNKPLRVTKELKNATMPCWSPDGKQIVFVYCPKGKADLWITSASGEGQPMRLTTSEGQNQVPSWSPDGKIIAFEKYLGGDKFRLYTIDVETKVEKEVPLPDIPYASHPRFSSDGRKLAFHFTAPGSPFLIGIADIKDPDAFFVVPVSAAANQNCCHPNWSPDGKYLLFSMGQTEAKYDIYRAIPDSSDSPICLVKGHGMNRLAAYSPDGTRILYESWPIFPARINVQAKVAFLNKEGLVDQTVTVVKNAFYPYWSPDGKRIAFSKDGDIWIVDAPAAPPK